MDKRQISVEEAAENGVVANHEQMPNSEYRYRLMQEGAGYILTTAGPEGAWQNSHFHEWIQECYIVQEGKMAYAEQEGDSFSLRVLKPGDMFTSRPGVSHNVYLYAGAKTHTVKFGNTAAERASGKVDWHASRQMDELTKHLTEGDIERLVSFDQ